MPFNPYHSWLGIRDVERPPNHYRLLGVELFESDPDVIATAADRQMAHVRRYQNGPHSDLSQKVLNELAVAKLCLLDDEQRASYDQHLTARQPNLRGGSAIDRLSEASTFPRQSRTDADQRQIPNTGITGTVELQPESVTTIEDPRAAQDQLRRAHPRPAWPWFIGTGLLLLLAIFSASRFLPQETPVEPAGGRTEPSAEAPPIPEPPPAFSHVTPQPAVTEPSDDPAEPVSRDDRPDPANGTDPTDSEPAPVASAELVHNGTDEEMIAASSSPPRATPEDATVEAGPHGPSDADDDGAESGGTVKPILPPIPTDYQLKTVRGQFERAYAHRIEQALAADGQAVAKLAGQLYSKARHTDSVNAKYILLTESMALAIRAGQSAIAGSAADQLTTSFDVDPVTIRYKIAKQTADALLSPDQRPTAADHAAFCAATAPMVQIALDRDDFEQANLLLRLLASSARKARSHSPDHEKTIEQLRADWTARKKAFVQVKLAKSKVIELVPDSLEGTAGHTSRSTARGQQLADAHWTIAHYEAFTKFNFAAAAAHLVASGHPHLSTIGVQEQEAPDTPDAQRSLGLLWLEFASQPKLRGNRPMTPAARIAALRRAQFWLEQALPELTGLEATETAETLATVARQLETEQAPAAVRVSLAFNGRTSQLSVPTLRYDGMSPLRIEALVKPAGPTGGYGTSATIVSNASPTGGFKLGTAGGYWQFTFATRVGKPLMVQARNRLQPDTWTRLVAAFDGSVMSLQVDETPPITMRVSAQHRASPFPLMIAASPKRQSSPPQEFFRGRLALLVIQLAAEDQPPALVLDGKGTQDASQYHHDVRSVDVEQH